MSDKTLQELLKHHQENSLHWCGGWGVANGRVRKVWLTYRQVKELNAFQHIKASKPRKAKRT